MYNMTKFCLKFTYILINAFRHRNKCEIVAFVLLVPIFGIYYSEHIFIIMKKVKR